MNEPLKDYYQTIRENGMPDYEDLSEQELAQIEGTIGYARYIAHLIIKELLDDIVTALKCTVTFMAEIAVITLAWFGQLFDRNCGGEDDEY